MYTPNRSRPNISIPQGAQLPVNPSPSARTPIPYDFEDQVTPINGGQHRNLLNPWEEWDVDPPAQDGSGGRPSTLYDYPGQLNPLPRSRASSYVTAPTRAFPEPQMHRSISAQPRPSSLHHRHSRSNPSTQIHREPSTTSIASSYYASDGVGLGRGDSYSTNFSQASSSSDSVSEDLSQLSLQSEDALLRFQDGTLPEKDQEWHRLVPEEALEALGNKEVQRQSVIFEVFKAEKDYVSDLEAVQQVFVQGLKNASPPVIQPKPSLDGFIQEVFGNLDQILAHHSVQLQALFARQRDQHPLIQSVADVILDTVLKSDFRSAYETYIKHYPLSESHHRKELKRNPAYQAFINSASSDPRIRKRDLITFLSRPVTRLPRLNLVLEQILKLTDKEFEHPDTETLPMILRILSDTVKSTQPGIEAAETKVKFWALCESLVFQKGEIIDMDLYDPSRSLIYSGALVRKSRDSEWSSWVDLSVALLDNYLLMTREEKSSSGIRRHLISRPLSLAYLRLGSFSAPPESRREHSDEGRLFDKIRYRTVPLYPFTIYHAANKASRRYTLYVSSEAQRGKWKSQLQHAMAIHRARSEGNMWFEPRVLSDQFFRLQATEPKQLITGLATCAAPFSSNGRKFVAVACPTGIYVSPEGSSNFRKVLTLHSTAIAAIQTHDEKVFNKFLVQCEGSILSYSLDLLARVSQKQAEPKLLDASREKIAGQDGNVLFFRVAKVSKRLLVIYVAKKRLQTTPSLFVLEAISNLDHAMSPTRTTSTAHSFRPFGEPGFIPKDAFDLTPLVKTIAVTTKDGMMIADPSNIARSKVSIVPDLSGAQTNLPMSALKERLDDARPLGLVRCEGSELLAIYDTIGFYLTKHGVPSRSSGYIKWDCRASAYAHRGPHVLLFSSQFIEIRDVNTGRLVQSIEGQDVRLLHSGPRAGTDNIILAAMRASDRKDGVYVDKVLDLAETSEVASAAMTGPISPTVWDEWDM